MAHMLTSWTPDVLHMICSQLRPDHLSLCDGRLFAAQGGDCRQFWIVPFSAIIIVITVDPDEEISKVCQMCISVVFSDIIIVITVDPDEEEISKVCQMCMSVAFSAIIIVITVHPDEEEISKVCQMCISVACASVEDVTVSQLQQQVKGQILFTEGTVKSVQFRPVQLSFTQVQI